MIFVTSGSSPLGYNELFQQCDQIAALRSDLIFVGQIGGSAYVPKNYAWRKWYAHDEMIAHLASADLVISHAGFGIISECLRRNKKLIVVPRQHAGNSYHSQSSLAEYLHEQGYLICVKDIAQLQKGIDTIRHSDLKLYISNSRIPTLIDEFISTQIKKKLAN
jgi:beta-1,4-N-acetylglucosaminyltransferase